MANTFTFSDGVLSIRTPLAQMRLRWKPEPAAEEMLVGARSWTPCFPEFRLVRPAEAVVKRPRAAPHDALVHAEADAVATKLAAFTAFRQEIPAAIVDPVAAFQSHQWPLMLMLHARPELPDLAQATPVLAYCLANNDCFRGTTPNVSLQLSLRHGRQKQRQQLEWLGFPGTEAMAKLLRRIPAEAASPSLLRRFGLAVSTDPSTFDLLAHVPVVNAGILELIVNPAVRSVVTPKLLHAVADSADEMEVAQAADKIEGALLLLKETGATEALRPLTTLAQVERLQETVDAAFHAHTRREEERRRIAEERRRQQRERRDEARRERRRRADERRMAMAVRQFPPPPLPGTDTIVPLTSGTDLIEEGKMMSNCVATYEVNVRRGHCYIYRVLAPTRATLSIVPGSGGYWRRSELKGKSNRGVASVTVMAVEAWLDQHRVSL